MALHDAAIIGFAETKIVPRSEIDVWELGAEILDLLLERTGFEKGEIDGLILSSSSTGAGNIFNAPLNPLDGSSRFREAFLSRILPALHNFGPDVLLISAGFDAHRDDPLAQIELSEEDFAWVTEKLVEIAERRAGGRVVSTLEGGYNLQALARSTAAHVEVLMQASS